MYQAQWKRGHQIKESKLMWKVKNIKLIKVFSLMLEYHWKRVCIRIIQNDEVPGRLFVLFLSIMLSTSGKNIEEAYTLVDTSFKNKIQTWRDGVQNGTLKYFKLETCEWSGN